MYVKLATDMNNYELTFVLPEKTTTAKKKSVLESIEKIVKMGKGVVGEVKDWGVKDLSYPIEKQEKGLFVHLLLELEPSFVSQLDTKLKMDENIIRYLIVRKDKE